MSAPEGITPRRQKAEQRTLAVDVPADQLDVLLDAVWANLDDWRDTTAAELAFVVALLEAREAEGKA